MTQKEKYIWLIDTIPCIRFLCTLKASFKHLNLPTHQHYTVAEACGFNPINRHDVLAGAEACAAIALKIL